MLAALVCAGTSEENICTQCGSHTRHILRHPLSSQKCYSTGKRSARGPYVKQGCGAALPLRRREMQPVAVHCGDYGRDLVLSRQRSCEYHGERMSGRAPSISGAAAMYLIDDRWTAKTCKGDHRYERHAIIMHSIRIAVMIATLRCAPLRVQQPCT